jgi:hypothetical protein
MKQREARNYKNYAIIGLFLMVIILFTCNNNGGREASIPIEIIRVDSTHTTDTVFVEIKVPYSVVHEVKIKSKDTNTFFYEEKDSNLTYRIKIQSDIKPVSVEMKYDLVQQIIIDSIYVRDSTNVVLKKSFMSGGAIVGKNIIAPSLTYSHKSGNNFSVGYDLLNENFVFGYSKKISFKGRR